MSPHRLIRILFNGNYTLYDFRFIADDYLVRIKARLTQHNLFHSPLNIYILRQFDKVHAYMDEQKLNQTKTKN